MKSTLGIGKLLLVVFFSIFFVLTIGIKTVSANPCGTKNAIAIGTGTMFPIIPTDINSKISNECSPPFWTITILTGLVYKMIRLLNWAAVSLATLAVVYSGFMYILGYANEENVKKSKSILKAAITGLVIVVCAKWIVYGTILMFSDNKTGGSGAQIQLFIP